MSENLLRREDDGTTYEEYQQEKAERQNDEHPAEWPTIAQAAEQIGISERALRRLIDAPENAAQTRQETRRTRTGTRQATVLSPDLVSKLAQAHRQNAGRYTGKMVADGGTTPAEDRQASAEGGAAFTETAALNGTTVADTPAENGATAAEHGDTPANDSRTLASPEAQKLATLQTDIEQIKAFLSGQLVSQLTQQMEQQAARLEQLPSREDLSAAVEQAAHQTVNRAVAPILERLEQQQEAAAQQRDEQAGRILGMGQVIESLTGEISTLSEQNKIVLAELERMRGEEHEREEQQAKLEAQMQQLSSQNQQLQTDLAKTPPARKWWPFGRKG